MYANVSTTGHVLILHVFLIEKMLETVAAIEAETRPARTYAGLDSGLLLPLFLPLIQFHSDGKIIGCVKCSERCDIHVMFNALLLAFPAKGMMTLSGAPFEYFHNSMAKCQVCARDHDDYPDDGFKTGTEVTGMRMVRVTT